MKPVQYAFATFAMLLVAACGSDSPNCTEKSTFAQVQEQIFEGRGCTASNCHGSSMEGGLDLRPANAYASLINVPATSGDYLRIFPAEQELSLLYQKVAAKTEGFSLNELDSPIAGSPMPTSAKVLSDDDLGLLRTWIRGGAPETGIVKDSDKYSTCDLQGEAAPNKTQPLPVPAVDEGIQFYSGGWTIPANGENEVCFVSYYDYSDRIPAGDLVPCGEAQGGREQDCFAYNKVILAQDPQSHHSIVEFYVPPPGKEEQYDPMHESWKDWTCLGGDRAGAACTPGTDECGERSQCTTEPLSTIGCIAYLNGPPELGTPAGFFGKASVRQNLVTAQEASFRESFPSDVFARVPVKGFIVWDSHGFNATESDTTLEQWMNLTFAPPDELSHERIQIFDADDIFGMGRIEAFSSKEVCASFTIPQYAHLLTLSSHTHRYGKEFRVWYPPNEPCNNADPSEKCQRPERESDYLSTIYTDPLYQRFESADLPAFDTLDPKSRTFRYCATWDNGQHDPKEVRRESNKPDAETCDFLDVFGPVARANGFELLSCGCEPEERSCFGGPNQGMLCHGDDAVCGEGGICDACPLGGGVTTEEEMFILLGSYYVNAP